MRRSGVRLPKAALERSALAGALRSRAADTIADEVATVAADYQGGTPCDDVAVVVVRYGGSHRPDCEPDALWVRVDRERECVTEWSLLGGCESGNTCVGA